ncbi:MAG: hypothetical protein QF884_05215 [Porticoccaceae bacterium]|jgi:hypothetical protein|nr:hypothetical protein [Porticoccaceae bacterium]
MTATVKKLISLVLFFIAIGYVVATDADMSTKVVDDDIGNVDGFVGAGETFYLQQVLPKLSENGCVKCHARGYMRPTMSYQSMLSRLAIGDSAENNAVIYKIANVRSFAPEIPNHPGGQRCATIDAEPCKSIRQWWQIEFGQQRTDK